MKRSSNSQPTVGREFIVRRQVFNHYFDRPLPTSTFHDLVNKGTILACPEMKGYYFLNRSLQRLGLPTVTKLPEAERPRSLEDITRFAFSIIDPTIFPPPPWLLPLESIDAVIGDHALRIANQHREAVAAISNIILKHHYFAGVLDCQFMIEQDALKHPNDSTLACGA